MTSFLKSLLAALLAVFVWCVGLYWLYVNAVTWWSLLTGTQQPYAGIIAVIMVCFVMAVSVAIGGVVISHIIRYYFSLASRIDPNSKPFLDGVFTTLSLLALATGYVKLVLGIQSLFPALDLFFAGLIAAAAFTIGAIFSFVVLAFSCDMVHSLLGTKYTL